MTTGGNDHYVLRQCLLGAGVIGLGTDIWLWSYWQDEFTPLAIIAAVVAVTSAVAYRALEREVAARQKKAGRPH